MDASELGREYAAALVAYEIAETRKWSDYHTMLPSIVADMPRDIGTIEISFLACIGGAAAGSDALLARRDVKRRAA